MRLKVIEHSRGVHETLFHQQEACEDHWLFYSSDWHFDNPKCNRNLLFKHLDLAMERGAGIFCFGDLFCFMQGRFDRRSDKGDIRPEHMQGNYIDVVIQDTAEKLRPYASNLVVIGDGNHETAIRKHHETDPIERLVTTIRNLEPSSPVCKGGYGGWIRHSSLSPGSTDLKNRRGIVSKYFHGSGGGGPVTKGAIQQQRMAAIVEGANLVYTGHIHENQNTTFVKERFIPQHNKIVLVEQEHIRGATYKEEYGDGTHGWHIERGGPPKPLGGWWIRCYTEFENGVLRPRFECTRAK